LLTTLEIGLRLAYPDKVSGALTINPTSLAFQFDEKTLISLKPNSRKKYIRDIENGGNTVTWKTNSLSFRGEELQTSPIKRVVIYGDSNVQARFSMLRNTFVFQLGQYLGQATGEKIEVVNAGVIGFGPDQSLIRFSSEVDALKPDLVIFHVFADNDFGDIVRNRLIELDERGRLQKVEYTPEPDQQLTFWYRLGQFIMSSLTVRMTQKIARIIEDSDSDQAKRFKMIKQMSVLSAKEFSVYLHSSPRIFSHFADHYDIDVALFPDSGAAKEETRLMKAVLAKAKTVAEENKVRIVVVIQPSAVDLTKNYMINYNDLKHFPQYDPRNLSASVVRACESIHLPFVNLFDIFVSRSPDTLFFKHGNNHWNDKGQTVAARAVADYVDSHHLLNVDDGH